MMTNATNFDVAGFRNLVDPQIALSRDVDAASDRRCSAFYPALTLSLRRKRNRASTFFGSTEGWNLRDEGSCR